jgi:acyl-CoA thioester hydrolase
MHPDCLCGRLAGIHEAHWRINLNSSGTGLVENETPFSISMQVRDYECDMQGIVNNAVYQNYLEWARHEFLRSRGLDFAELTARGIIVVVIRAELDYLRSLRSRDTFKVTVATRQVSRLKLVFDQEIVHIPDRGTVLRASITATTVNERNRPYFHEDLKKLL